WFMPLFEHIIGVVTHILSIIAVYLMVRATPESAKPLTRYLLLLQITITLTDLNFGLLLCPISLAPAPAALCTGLLCSYWRLPAHIGMIIAFFTLGFVAFSVVLCLHHKFVTISRLSHNRRVSKIESILLRVALFTLLSSPGIILCTLDSI
ncbi:hypothetical protein PFISCL1PPCAC_14508, partial [Pristionchus fissidentatus]